MDNLILRCWYVYLSIQAHGQRKLYYLFHRAFINRSMDWLKFISMLLLLFLATYLAIVHQVDPKGWLWCPPVSGHFVCIWRINDYCISPSGMPPIAYLANMSCVRWTLHNVISANFIFTKDTTICTLVYVTSYNMSHFRW